MSYVDLHCHILPGLDDGAATMDETLRHARRQPAERAHDDALALSRHQLHPIAQGPAGAKWLLLECPFAGIDDDFLAAAERLSTLGFGLLLAHPERAADGHEHLWPLLEQGALLQVNVCSLLGNHGLDVQELATDFVRRGLAYCL